MKTKLCVLTVAALIAWGLKRHYASAEADDLWWILTPTARAVGVVTGAVFQATAGEGYVSRERLFVIEKSCAGINFMIAAFVMMTLMLTHRITSALSGARMLIASVAASYGAAVLVNTTRITIAMWLAAHPPVSGLTAAEIHRLEGIAVYFAGLVALYEIARRVDCGIAAARIRA